MTTTDGTPVAESEALELTHPLPAPVEKPPRQPRNWGRILRITFEITAFAAVAALLWTIWAKWDETMHGPQIPPAISQWAQGCTQDINSCRGNIVYLRAGYQWRVEGTANDSARLATMMNDLMQVDHIVRPQDGNPQDPYVAASLTYYNYPVPRPAAAAPTARAPIPPPETSATVPATVTTSDSPPPTATP